MPEPQTGPGTSIMAAKKMPMDGFLSFAQSGSGFASLAD